MHRKPKKSVGQLEMSGWVNENMHPIQRGDRATDFIKILAFCLPLLAALAGCEHEDNAPTKVSKASQAPKASAARINIDPNWDRNTSHFPSLGAYDYLLPGDYMESPHVLDFSRRRFYLQGDGNLVLYNVSKSPWKALWASNTVGLGGDLLLMQSDGNLVLYNTQASTAVWQSETCCYPAANGVYFDIGSDLESNGKWVFTMQIFRARGGAAFIKEIYRGE